MKDAYSNVAGPPRTTVKKVVRPIGRQIVFDLTRIEHKSLCDLASAQEFARQRQVELDAVPRPKGFMVGISYEELHAELESNMKAYPDFYQVCTDPVLALAVLGRVSGLIYVPHRELRLTDACFDPMSFPAEYFPQFGGAS